MNNTSETVQEEAVAAINYSDFGPAAKASLGSVILALYFYYIRGDRQRGQFIGLWPSTILALATYLRLEQIKQTLANADD